MLGRAPGGGHAPMANERQFRTMMTAIRPSVWSSRHESTMKVSAIVAVTPDCAPRQSSPNASRTQCSGGRAGEGCGSVVFKLGEGEG